jgi:hypothetical protein
MDKEPDPANWIDWQRLFLREDAEGIWNGLFSFVKASMKDYKSDCHRITQDIFLYLLVTGKINRYTIHRYPPDKINRELQVLLSSLMASNVNIYLRFS